MAIAPKRGESGRIEINIIRYMRHQVLRHQRIFRVDSESAPGAGNAVAGLETLQTGTNFHDRSGAGITQGHRLVEAIECRIQRGEDAFTEGFVDHLFCKVGTGTRFLQQVLLAKLHQHPFGPG